MHLTITALFCNTTAAFFDKDTDAFCNKTDVAVCMLMLCPKLLNPYFVEVGCVTIPFVNANSRMAWNLCLKLGPYRQDSLRNIFDTVKFKILIVSALTKFQIMRSALRLPLSAKPCLLACF